MSIYEVLTLFAGFVFVYSVVAGGVARTPISSAIVYTAFGWLIGPLALGLFDLEVTRHELRALAEVTLAVLLFTDAANLDLAVLRRAIGLPQRLLLIGLPLTILLGFATGVALFESLTLIEAAILAAMLAPTDAALGAAVVSDERVPANMRQGLNTESGLNDGICVPVLFVFLALAGAGEAHEGASGAELALVLLAEELGIGAAVGLGLAFAGARMIDFCSARGWITEVWRQLPVIALALGCFACAQWIGGSGFIAAFVGGLLFGALRKAQKGEFLHAAEGTGETLQLITWVVFGAVVVGHTAHQLTWPVIAYAVLSLTLVRMLPVVLALTGTGLALKEKLFMGWFGPRGMASIVFAVIVVNEQLPGGSVLTQTVVATIVLSILLHGLSANPLVGSLFGRDSHGRG
jgi:NhaP-type Na+/H+ or K+/H+ antiporter